MKFLYELLIAIVIPVGIGVAFGLTASACYWTFRFFTGM